MHINKIKVKNFKRFECRVFDFNKDINILVGDNDSGKSTILEAIEIACNRSYRGKSLASEVTPDLFCAGAVKNYLESNKSESDLPEICIELFLEGVPEYRGDNNSLGEDTEGISLKIAFDGDLLPVYEKFVKNSPNINTIPVEFYKTEWMDFSWKKIKAMNKKVSGVVVDPTRLHPTYGKNRFISNAIERILSKEEQALLNLNYRQLREVFGEQSQVVELNKLLDADNLVTEKSLTIVANVSSASRVETGLQFAVDDVNFPLIGKGEQNKIQIKLDLQNKTKDDGVIMIEEPENHLSPMNLAMLVKYLEDHRNDRQLFVTTHSSFVLNKLSMKNICLIADKYIRFKEIDGQVTKRLKRLPGYDTLRAVLSGKTILVEGPSDELILKRIYLCEHGRLPEEDGIEIIVVRGIGFKNYLEIAKQTGATLKVIKDNDGDYEGNIQALATAYGDCDNITMISSDNDDLYSLEPVLIECNSGDEITLDTYAKIALSKMTFNEYETEATLESKISFLVDWYKGKGGSGKKKVDSAMRIFESSENILYPEFLKEALVFE